MFRLTIQQAVHPGVYPEADGISCQALFFQSELMVRFRHPFQFTGL